MQETISVSTIDMITPGESIGDIISLRSIWLRTLAAICSDLMNMRYVFSLFPKRKRVDALRSTAGAGLTDSRLAEGGTTAPLIRAAFVGFAVWAAPITKKERLINGIKHLRLEQIGTGGLGYLIGLAASIGKERALAVIANAQPVAFGPIHRSRTIYVQMHLAAISKANGNYHLM